MLILLLSTLTLRAQEKSGLTIPINVIRTRLDVRVALKHSSEAVNGLTTDDFVVSESGHKVAVKSADRESVALDLILMLDASDSMNHVASELTAAAKDLFRILGPQDRIAVVEYGGSSKVVAGFTTNRSEIEDALRQAAQDVGKIPGATATYDAIGEAAKLFEGPPDGSRRRAIVVVTDDLDNSSNASAHHTASAVLEHDAVLMAVVIKSALATATKTLYKIQPGRFILPMRSLKPVAAETGGEFLPGHDAAALVKSALDAIRTRYLITYVPDEAGCARVSVDLSRAAKARYPDAVVRAPRLKLGSQPAVCR